MRVIPPRRSSKSAAGSGSPYGSTSSAGSLTGSSSVTSSSVGSSGANSSALDRHGIVTSGAGGVGGSGGGPNGCNRYSTSYDRAGSLSKWSGPTSSSAGFGVSSSATAGYGSNYYPSSYISYSTNYTSNGTGGSSYTPRNVLHRSSVGSSTSASSYLSGGAGSGASAYRTSYLSFSNYDSPTYNRYGLPRKTASKVTTNGDSSGTSSSTSKRDDYGGSLRRSDASKKPPPSGGSGSASSETNGHNNANGKRLASSSSSPSLARLVATSGLDIYEKYSPANYKPNCELSRSRSGLAADSSDVENGNDGGASTTTTVTLERPRSSRYSRLYSNSSDAGDAATSTTTRRSGSGKYTLSSSNSSGDVPTATFTLRNRTRRNAEEVPSSATAAPPPPPPPPPPAPVNGHKSRGREESNGLEAKLNGLSLLSTSPKRNAIYESRSGSSLRNLDTTDDAGVTVAESNGDVSATATLKLGDKEQERRRRLKNRETEPEAEPPRRMMIEIKKARGFHKIPQSSKLQSANSGATATATGSPASASASAAAAGTSIATGVASTVDTTAKGTGTGTGTGTATGAGNQTSSGRGTGSVSRLKGSKHSTVSTGAAAASVAVGKSHAALAAAKYGGGGGVATGVRSAHSQGGAGAGTGAGATGGGGSVTSVGSNPVRAANQRYFLVSTYKDPTFLKAECDLAHAQVTTASHKGRSTVSIASSGSRRNRAGEDSKNNNPGAGHGGGHHRIITATTLADMRRQHLFNGNQQTGSASGSTTITTNSGTGSGSRNGTTITATASANTNTASTASIPHSEAITTGSHLLKYSARSAGGATASAQHHHHQQLSHKLHKIKSSSHSGNNNSAGSTGSMMNGHSATSNNNNNSGATIGGGNNAVNNNMQRQQQQQLQQQQQHDDITYIDSDEPATGAGGSGGASAGSAVKTSICYFKPITPPPLRQHHQQREHQQRRDDADTQSGPGGKRYQTRPRSTIISSGHSNFVASYEKFNSYRQANGGDTSAVAEGRNSGGANARRYGIDSLSIKASIDKFNSLSGQKQRQLTPTPSASGSASGAGAGSGNAVASGPAAGSTTAVTAGRGNQSMGSSSGNLQQRYSSDLDCIRVSAGYSSSLTRAAYRTTATVSVASTATSAGTEPGALAGATAVVTPISKVSMRGSHSGRQAVAETEGISKVTNNDNATPTAAAAAAAAPPTSTATSSVSTTATSTVSGTASGPVTGSSNSNSNSNTNSNSASDSTTGTGRNVLPPVSPTSSRYWDRDSNRSGATTSSLKISGTDDGYKSSKDEKLEGLCGLRNIGNTCFMNSVIQCLSHTQELTRFLRSHHGSRATSTKDQQILQEFAKLIQEMWTSNVHTVTPMELKRAFSTKHRMYSDYNQQDAQEFLRFFLDSLHSALNSGVKGETLNIDDNLSDNKKADLTWEWYTRHENSLVRDLFVGQLKSTLKCTTCGNTSVTFDPFWDLSVPLPSSSRCKLEACLDLFIREEVLDGDEMPTCSKCKTRRKCTKSFTIQRFPKYLVIHLKRFSETRWSKLSNIVEFPTGDRELNMGSYGSNSNANVHYSLYAISNHMGSTAGGHYVALCKHPVSRKWHEFNDNIVSDTLSDNFLVTASAYILFYERA